MTSDGPQNILSVFFTKDPNLLKDVLQLRSSDVVHLTRRLETAAKSLAPISSSLDPAKEEVRDFISQLNHCYIAASESTRVCRGLEKVLEATGPHCEALVTKTLGAELVQLLLQVQLSSSWKDLKKVSTLLEHSKRVQEEVSQIGATLVDRLGSLFRKLLQPPPSALSREDRENLYYTVKISLQLFQQTLTLRQEAWVCLKSLVSEVLDTGVSVSDSKQLLPALSQAVNGLVAVLARKVSVNYAKDVTLLAATAISMVINAADTPEESAQAFFALHSFLTDSASSERLSNLHLQSTEYEDQHSGRHNHTAEIALLQGILLGSTQIVLCSQVKNCDPDSHLPAALTKSAPTQAFLLALFPLVCKLCDAGTEFQYLSFQLLSFWTQKLSACVSRLVGEEKYDSLMGRDSAIVSETLKRVWLSLDSPVYGVAEIVAETLKTLLQVWRVEVENGRSDYADLAEELMAKTVQVPWYARSRYTPLRLLMPYVDTDKLLAKTERLKGELLECMGASFLTALAGDVYTAFLLSIREKCGKEERAEAWRKTWLPTFVAGLTSSDRNKVCDYWLTSTLETLPSTGPLIQRHLEARLQAGGDQSVHCQLLFAWVAVCRILRTRAGLDLSTLPEQLLVEAVYSDEEDVSSEALFLLSATQKKAEPLGEVETRLLQLALPHCLKVDSASFRQKLVTSLRKVFVRVRDSCSSAVKRRQREDFVDCSLQFMDWLYRLVMSNLVPGACFQRRRTCLDIILAWLETVIFVETDGSKKGKAQGPTDVLMRYAGSKGWWDFFSAENRTCLLHCVMDGADEIQKSAVHILSKYFPWTLDRGSPPASTPHVSDLANHLLNHGLSQCNSPRAYENHSGALLVRLMYEKFVREQGCRFHFPQRGSKECTVAPEHCAMLNEVCEKSSACVSFFTDILLSGAEASLKCSETDVLLASKVSPSHGLLQALCECLQAEQACCRPMDHGDWQNLLSRTVSLCFSIISLVLSVLANGQAGNCPSFAQMGMALEQLVTEGAEEQEVTSSLSPEFQLLLSWCWLNLKESCTCLGTVTAMGVKWDGARGRNLPVDVVENIGETFLRVLTHCRHRGAIEGCRSGFLQFCASLMACEDPVLSTVPANILTKVLSSLEKDEITSSVTRRSAGLPIIIQTIAQVEKRCRSNKLLQQTVDRLYAVASRPPTSVDCKQTQDQAPVHALNVLKVVFSDASLAPGLLPHLGKVMELVICSFESSSWAVRNAATQLVSTLVTRMFGQRNRASLSRNMVTLQELSARFPELLAFACQKLECSLGEQGETITAVQPSLFLVLTLLASLGPAAQSSHCHRLTASLRTTVLSAISSPVYHLRELSATAVVALTPLDMTEGCVDELLGRVGPGSSGDRSSNGLHGTLMCLEKLLTTRTVSPRVAEAAVQHVVSHRALVSGSLQCPLVSARCVDVLKLTAPKLPLDSPLRGRLVEVLVGAVFSTPVGDLQFGRELLISSACSLIVSLLQSSSQPPSISLQEFTSSCLISSDVEIRSAMLDCLCRTESVFLAFESGALQRALWQRLREETDASCVIRISRLLVDHYLDKAPSLGDLEPDLNLDDLDEIRSRFDKLANVQAALFPVEALVLSQQRTNGRETDAQERLSSSLCVWSARLAEFSQPCQNEDFRLAAAQALALAGQSALSFCAAPSGEDTQPWMASLVESCMVLLEETDSQIRRVVTRFVGKLDWTLKEPKV
ncbi:hypothetical protein ACOMHN_042572 [Nucella lapillus]